MPKKKKGTSTMMQTTIRMDPEKLREAQYYLSLERLSLSHLVNQLVTDFIKEYRKAHPEHVPRGAKEL